jgi:hypothetical protein
MILGYKDGTVVVVDVDRPETSILKAKFEGGEITHIDFTSALSGIMTATMDDGRVWVLPV